MKTKRNDIAQDRVWTRSLVMRLLTTFCVAVYSLIPSFAYCTCSGSYHAVDSACCVSKNVEEEEHVEVKRCSHCAHKQKSAARQDVKRNACAHCGCSQDSQKSHKNCCVTFYKIGAVLTAASSFGVDDTSKFIASAWTNASFDRLLDPDAVSFYRVGVRPPTSRFRLHLLNCVWRD